MGTLSDLTLQGFILLWLFMSATHLVYILYLRGRVDELAQAQKKLRLYMLSLEDSLITTMLYLNEKRTSPPEVNGQTGEEAQDVNVSKSRKDA